MKNLLVALVILLIAMAGVSEAATQVGIVTEVTSDTLTIQGDVRTETYKVSARLLTNTPDSWVTLADDKFVSVKKGDKLSIDYLQRGTDLICVYIRIDESAPPAQGNGVKPK